MKLTCATVTFNVIKAGNRESLIRCVESVAELATDHEHLIYDGASTDGTVELLRELERTTPRLKVVSEPDTGIYNALNKCLRTASGEWFYVLGSDDYLCNPEAMDEILRTTTRNVRMIIAPVDWGIKGCSFVDKSELRGAFSGYINCHQGILLRTEVARAYNGFDESYKLCADVNLILKVHTHCLKTRYCQNVFAHYSTDGYSSRNQKLFETESNRIVLELFGLKRPIDAAKIGFILRHIASGDFYLRNSAKYLIRQWAHRNLRLSNWPLYWIYRKIQHH